MDAETGLAINPNPAPQSGKFLVVGPVTAVNAIPQDKPTFTVRIPGGGSYTIYPQPLLQILTDEGNPLKPHEYRPGLVIRATVEFDPTVAAGTPGFKTDDMIVVLNQE